MGAMGVEMGLASQPESELKEGEAGGGRGYARFHLHYICTTSLMMLLYFRSESKRARDAHMHHGRVDWSD